MQSVVAFCALSSASHARLLHESVRVLLPPMHIDLSGIQVGMPEPVFELVWAHAARDQTLRR